jgi:hypothetical protein
MRTNVPFWAAPVSRINGPVGLAVNGATRTSNTTRERPRAGIVEEAATIDHITRLRQAGDSAAQ